MTAPAVIRVVRVPDQWSEGTQRVINDNFLAMKAAVERAILTGGLIGSGVLAGDVTGAAGSNTVTKIRNKNVPAPTVTEHLKYLQYNNTSGAFQYATAGSNALLDGSNHTDTVAAAVQRGDLIIGNSTPKWDRLGKGAANTVLKSDGTDPSYATLTSLLDSLFSSSQGAILYRDAATWAALAPGTSGHFLKTLGGGANPLWAAPAGGLVSPLTTKGDIWAYSTVDDRFPVGAAADGTVLTRDAASTFGIKWAAAGGSNALLDGTVHTDTVAAAVVRGHLIIGNSTPKWDILAIGTTGKGLLSNGSDPGWGWLRRLPSNRPIPYSCVFGNAAATNNGFLTSTNAGGTEADAAETGAGSRFPNKYTQAVNGGTTGRQTTSSKIKAEMSPVFYADFKIVTVNTGASSVMSFSCGFDTGLFGANKGVRNQARVEWLQGTDTNFRFLLGDGTNLNDQDTTILKDAAWHDVLIYTPDNGTTWKCEIDGVQTNSSSTNVPTTTTVMLGGVGFACTGANASNTPEIRNSYQHIWLLGGP